MKPSADCVCSKIDEPLKPKPNERMRDFGLEIDSVLVRGVLAVAEATVTAEYSDACVDMYVYECVIVYTLVSADNGMAIQS